MCVLDVYKASFSECRCNYSTDRTCSYHTTSPLSCSCYHGHLASLKPLSHYKLAQGVNHESKDVSIVSPALLHLFYCVNIYCT